MTIRSLRYARLGGVLLITATLAGCLGSKGEIRTTTLVPAPLPAYRQGDLFTYRDEKGRTLTREVVASTPERTEWVTESGYRFTKGADIFVPQLAWEGTSSRGRALSVKVEGGLWPLAYKKRSTVTIDYEKTDKKTGAVKRYSELWRCRVNKPRRFEVPAGDFDTYKVVCKRHDPETDAVTRTHIWYYAPALGHYVKRIKKYADGRRKEISLVSWRRGEPKLAAAGG